MIFVKSSRTGDYFIKIIGRTRTLAGMLRTKILNKILLRIVIGAVSAPINA